MSQVALRLPDSLHAYAKQMAANDESSLNQFIVMAVAEKISAYKTETFFAERAAKGCKDKFHAVMAKVKNTLPLAGDSR
jgi:hypothetical protein